MKFLVIASFGDGIDGVQVVEAENQKSACKIACGRFGGLVDEAWLKFKAYKLDDLWDGFAV